MRRWTSRGAWLRGTAGAAIALALAPTAQAQSAALSLSDTRVRAVRTRTLMQTLDESGLGLVELGFGPELVTSVSFERDQVTAKISGPNAPMLPIGIQPLAAGEIELALTEGVVTQSSDQVTTIDRRTGAARLSRTASGTVRLSIRLGSQLLSDLNVNVQVSDFAATDMGPLFLAEALATAVPAAGAALEIAGPGFVCAMPDSPFLAEPALGVPDCTSRSGALNLEAFGNLVPIQPAPFDAQSGEIRAVGLRRIAVEPFEVFGVPVRIAPLVLLSLSSVQRISELESPAQ